jgi:hypothetical protein
MRNNNNEIFELYDSTDRNLPGTSDTIQTRDLIVVGNTSSYFSNLQISFCGSFN